jgi:small conductance mechanosensitive channel
MIKVNKLNKKRQDTIKNLFLKFTKYLILLLIVVEALKICGIDVTSILAGVGIAGIVIGLALQDIMKDILSGTFIIIENQYDIGDWIEVNGFLGEVKDLNLRSTKLKGFSGEIKTISNRNISEVKNVSKTRPNVLVDLTFPYDTKMKDIDKLTDIIINRIEDDIEEITGKVVNLGLADLAASSVNIKLMVETKLLEQFSVKRKINRIIKEEFDNNKISIPFQTIEVVNGK